MGGGADPLAAGLARAQGMDATSMYDDVMHSPAADDMMERFRVGRYAPTEAELEELRLAQLGEVKGFRGSPAQKAALSLLPVLVAGAACAYAAGAPAASLAGVAQALLGV